jgi:hypothetical protein
MMPKSHMLPNAGATPFSPALTGLLIIILAGKRQALLHELYAHTVSGEVLHQAA